MHKVIVFDGVCLLCHSMVRMLIKWDKKKIFRYTSLQGTFVKQLEIEEAIDSIILYDEGKLYYKSTAILKILRSLGGMWVVVNVFYLIPTFIRDGIYDLIATYRYRFFGKLESCHMPEAGEERLFIE